MKSAAILLCILLAAAFAFPVLAQEPSVAVTTEPAILHGVTRDITPEPTAIPTTAHTAEPTKERTTERTLAPTP